MQKIVITTKYDFGLSHKAIMRYAEIKGIKLWVTEDDDGKWYFTKPPQDKAEDWDNLFVIWDSIPRDDPALVRVVEELGEEANDGYSKLKIVEVPDNVKWHIGEGGEVGGEWVAEMHRTWR